MALFHHFFLLFVHITEIGQKCITPQLKKKSRLNVPCISQILRNFNNKSLCVSHYQLSKNLYWYLWHMLRAWNKRWTDGRLHICCRYWESFESLGLQTLRGEGAGLTNVRYTGMCRPTGSTFSCPNSGTGCHFWPWSLGLGSFWPWTPGQTINFAQKIWK